MPTHLQVYGFDKLKNGFGGSGREKESTKFGGSGRGMYLEYEILRELIKSLILKRFLASKETQTIDKCVEHSRRKVRKSPLLPS